MSETEIEAEAGAGNVRSVFRAVDILKSFVDASGPLTVADIKRSVPLSRPTLYRLLDTLVAAEMLHVEGSPQRFRLGRMVARLGRSWADQLTIDVVAQPIMQALRDATGETCALFEVRDGRQFCVLESKSRHALSMSRGIGELTDGFHGASGIAILAWMDRDEALALAKQTTPEDKPRITAAELVAAQAAGYAISHGAIYRGAASIAAPVFDHNRKVFGSLALFGPEARIRDDGLDMRIAQLRDAARRLSADLGGPPTA